MKLKLLGILLAINLVGCPLFAVHKLKQAMKKDSDTVEDQCLNHCRKKYPCNNGKMCCVTCGEECPDKIGPR